MERWADKTWAQQLKRVFNIDVEKCRICGGTAKVVACIEDPAPRLLAVSKQQPLAAVGQIDSAENRMQEALDKIGQCSLPGIRWHFIGYVQTNKTGFHSSSS